MHTKLFSTNRHRVLFDDFNQATSKANELKQTNKQTSDSGKSST